MPEKLLLAFVRAVKQTMNKQELQEGLLKDQWPELPLAAWLDAWPTSVPQRAVPPQAPQPVAPEKKKVKKKRLVDRAVDVYLQENREEFKRLVVKTGTCCLTTRIMRAWCMRWRPSGFSPCR